MTRRPRAPRRLWWRALLAGFAVWAVVAIGLCVVAAVDARRAAAALDELRATYATADLLEGEGRSELQAVQARFARASTSSGSPLVAPLRLLPFAGRQLRSLHALSSAGETVLDVALDAASAADGLASGELPDVERVDAVEELLAQTSTARRRLAALRLGPDEALLDPLADARATLADEIDEALTSLGRAEEVTTGVVELLRGSSYLVLAANNAEMQAGWGMPLSVGVLEVEDGELRLDRMQPASDLQLPSDGVQAEEGDLADHWAFLRPGQDFRLLAVTPHFADAAPVAAEMWEALGNPPVDGVLALDAFALQAILQATGPVEVEGREVGPDDVIPFLLHDQYVEQGDLPAGVAARQERQSAIAVQAVAAATSPGVDLIELVRQLGEVSQRRHVLLWSSAPRQQAAWEAAGVSGALTPASLLVAPVNRGGNKLDWFVDVAGVISSQREGDLLEVAVEVTLTNETPEGEPLYIAGPYDDGRGSPVDAAGDWTGYLSIHLPAAAGSGRIDDIDPLLAAGASGEGRLIAAKVEVLRGRSSTFVVRFSLPADAAELVVEPSARVRPVEWRSGNERWSDDEGRRTVSLDG